jgi:NADPH2:quinone reductase
MTELMRAVGYHRNLPISDPESLRDLTVAVPEPGAHDLLVRVRAVSVNPVDVKMRVSGSAGAEPKILGYDAAGVVERVGSAVTLFRPGDEVWYAGSIARPGTNAELHLVDERIVGPKPASLTFAEAAALPLTALTAWESLFDRLRLTADSAGRLLVLGAAGGVGSVLVQLARQLTELDVVGTASRPESQRH